MLTSLAPIFGSVATTNKSIFGANLYLLDIKGDAGTPDA
jgi:hypothetical protein